MIRKKLLYVGNALSSSGKTVTTIETLSDLLRQEGYEVTITSSKSNKILRMLDMTYTLLRTGRKMDTVLIDVYSTTNFWYAVIIAQICRWLHKDYIPILHGGNLPERLDSYKYTSYRLFSNAKVNVAPSDYLYNAFAKANFKNLTRIPNTIAIDKYPFKQRSVFKPNLLWVRSFDKIYNPLLAIKVLEELAKEYPEATLTMIGPDKDGSLQKCKGYAEENALNIVFTGKLSKDQWIERATTCDIFINTTNYDNTPVSVIEAMALGLPVISTNVGGLPFLIDDTVNGYLTAPNDIALFTKRVAHVIDHPKDMILVTHKARETAATYDWAEIKNLWHEVLY